MTVRKSWKEYELYITRHFQKQFPNTSIQHDVKRKGLMSRTKRQIDILIEGKLAGIDLAIIVDCKYFDKRVGIKEVESFLSFLRDLKASKGILITNRGYTKAAHDRATYDSQDVELRIIDFKDLEQFQGFMAIPYSGSHCAVVTAPDGWVVDASQNGPYVASFYPAGMSQEEALSAKEFIYLSFSHKDRKWPNLAHLLATQKKSAEEHYNNPKIEYLNTIKRKDCSVTLRVLDAQEHSDTIEYTIFLDFPGVIIFMTLLSPTSKKQPNLKKLEWLAQKSLKGNVVLDKTARPVNLDL